MSRFDFGWKFKWKCGRYFILEGHIDLNLKCQKLNLFMVLHLMINDHVFNIPGDCACICLLSIVIESNLDSHRATPMFQWLFFIFIAYSETHMVTEFRFTDKNSIWWCICCCCLRFEMRYRHTYESECKAHMVQHLFQAKSLRYKYIFVCVTWFYIFHFVVDVVAFFSVYFFFFSYRSQTYMVDSFSCSVCIFSSNHYFLLSKLVNCVFFLPQLSSLSRSIFFSFPPSQCMQNLVQSLFNWLKLSYFVL